MRVIPAVLATVVLGAHFLRDGHQIGAVAVALSPLLLLVGRFWAVRAVQSLLSGGAVIWVHTLIVLSAERRASGEPFVRMAIILGAIALVTILAAMLLDPLAPRGQSQRESE